MRLSSFVALCFLILSSCGDSTKFPSTMDKNLIKKAIAGDPIAQNNIGVIYQNGEGVTQNHKKAIGWYRKAAQQDYSLAQYNLGHLLYLLEKEKIFPDYTEPIKWINKAAKQGYAPAQNLLGLFYEEGDGVHKSYKEAFKWYSKAAKQGNKAAKELMIEVGIW